LPAAAGKPPTQRESWIEKGTVGTMYRAPTQTRNNEERGGPQGRRYKGNGNGYLCCIYLVLGTIVGGIDTRRALHLGRYCPVLRVGG